MDIHQIIHQKLVKLSQLNHVIEIIFWSGRNWRKRRRRVIFTFLLICNFKSIFLFCRLQSPDYFYLILLEYKNVPTEVNFISRKPDWKWAMLTKVTRWGFPFACWVEIGCYLFCISPMQWIQICASLIQLTLWRIYFFLSWSYIHSVTGLIMAALNWFETEVENQH